MRRHRWKLTGNAPDEQVCLYCRRTRRPGKGPRGAKYWEFKDGNRWAQYTSGNDPKCIEVRS